MSRLRLEETECLKFHRDCKKGTSLGFRVWRISLHKDGLNTTFAIVPQPNDDRRMTVGCLRGTIGKKTVVIRYPGSEF